MEIKEYKLVFSVPIDSLLANATDYGAAKKLQEVVGSIENNNKEEKPSQWYQGYDVKTKVAGGVVEFTITKSPIKTVTPKTNETGKN